MNEVEALVLKVITENGGRVLPGELPILLKEAGLIRDGSRYTKLASTLVGQKLLVRPARGLYYTPERWEKTSEHERMLARFPLGLSDPGRILYAIWLEGEDEQLETAEVRAKIQKLFGVIQKGGGGFTMLCEQGYILRVKKGLYQLIAHGKQEIEKALVATDVPEDDEAELENHTASATQTATP